ncbi:phosphoserine phosphatase SerB [Candidatus Thioglobus sp.]|jgi:phosphoserine phosphatase (EC 3.1.3.3)|uniref:phosphoserine phosphatase SerB n=1 Tax=Candidatus Thioglobus sp. TaxID=2026721 RepID=UPI003242BEA8
MKTIIQHSTDTQIATQIADTYHCKIKHYTSHIRLYTDHKIDLDVLRQTHLTDFNYLPIFDFSQIKLFVSDMDSTLINIECIDEIADFANIKPQVAAITERAMQGELDFNASLIERVSLLKGLDIDVLDKVYTERLQVNPGGKDLIKFFKDQGIRSAVVSGGFTYFTHRLAKDIGLDHDRANELDIENNQLTGITQGSIINATAKSEFVIELCDQYQISPNQVIVAGDGANDLAMMSIAGLSVAYHAKPSVIKQANIVISFGGLDKIRDFFDE